MSSATPFTDTTLIRGRLYAGAGRLAQRTNALHRAKISGEDATATITGLAAMTPEPAQVLDIGCGRGTTTISLARRYPGAVTAIDQSPALLAAAYERLLVAGTTARIVCGDFHQLPIRDESADVAIASFCLYHSRHPERALAEISRCLHPGGHLIATTKSATSYSEIDGVLASSGIDPGAAERQSLYSAFHSGNAERIITAAGLTVCHRLDQRHVFEFTDFAHLAEYAITCPKYRPRPGHRDATAMAAALQAQDQQERAVTATSTVTYLVAARP